MRVALFAILAVLMAGCTDKTEVSVQATATPKAVLEQKKLGARLYTQHCAHCHEQDSGEGPRLKAKVLATHGNAARLFKYNKKYMPYGLDMRLTDEEYWAITAYLVTKKCSTDVEGDLGPDNAEALSLKIQKTPKP